MLGWTVRVISAAKLRQLARTRDDVIAAAVRLVELLKTRFKLRPLVHSSNSVLAAIVVITCIMLVVAATTLARRADKGAEADMTPPRRRVGKLYYPTPSNGPR